MPNVVVFGSLRIYFYSNEYSAKGVLAPIHVHVADGKKHVKVWLSETKYLKTSQTRGFKPHEIRKVLKIVEHYKQEVKDLWDSHFDLGEDNE